MQVQNLCIAPVEQYDKFVGLLVSQMSFARFATFNVCRNLSVLELDYIFDTKANSIGSLLLHIGAIEYKSIIEIFEQRPFTPDEDSFWGAALGENLLKRTIKNHDIEYYINMLNNVRKSTLIKLREVDDKWLFEKLKLPNGLHINNAFRIFHIAEDEISHTGQIIWLKKRLPPV